MTTFPEKMQRWLGGAAQTAATLLKTALLSRRVSRGRKMRDDDEVVILGNGPSLRETIDEHGDWLAGKKKMAVNFAANADDYSQLKPDYYILADPHFFNGRETNGNVRKLWQRLAATHWPMTLYVPAKEAAKARELIGPGRVEIKTMNLTPGEGWRPVVHRLYDAGLAMPRPRNVLIPALMTAVREGYGTIWVCGADHSWTRTLSVDDENRVVSIQPHFYKDDDKERQRVATEYKGYHLHDILHSLTVAFRSYFAIKDYAERRGATIINVTPGSFIDAFERRKL